MTTLEHERDEDAAWSGLPRWAGLSVSVVILLAILIWASGAMIVDVLTGLATDGLFLGLWLIAANGAGAFFRSLPLRGRLGGGGGRDTASTEPPDAPRLHPASPGGGGADAPLSHVTSISIGLGVIGLLVHGLGLLGLNLTLPLLIGLAIVGHLPLLMRMNGTQVDAAAWLRSPSAGATSFILLALPLGLALASASIAPGFMWKPLDPHPYDAMAYHLQVPREWHDAGRVMPLTHNVFSYFPMAMESHYLAAMQLRGGPWQGMYLCQLMTLTHGVLAVLAVAAVAKSLGARSWAAWGAAVLAAGVPWTMMLSSVAYVESGVMLYTVLVAGWAALALRNQSPKSHLAIAGVCAGLACGMKYTAFVMTGTVGFGAAAVFLLSRRQWKPLAVFAVTTAAVASPWLIRNVAWTGNPVFPLATSVFGSAHFTPDQVDRYNVAHRPPDAEAGIVSRVKSGFDRTLIDPQFGYLIFPAALMAAAMSWRSRPAMLLLAMGLGMTGVWLAATHVMPRFLTPVIPLAAVLISLIGRGRRTQWVAVVLGVAQLAIGVTWTIQQAAPQFAVGREGLFRLPDYRPLEDPAVTAALDRGQPVALVGEGQAFFYRGPSTFLSTGPTKANRYRSVFDIHSTPNQSLADQWLGQSIEQLRAAGYVVVINESELWRLASTYRHLSGATPPTRNESIVLPPR